MHDVILTENIANPSGYVSSVEELNAEQITKIYNGFLHRFG